MDFLFHRGVFGGHSECIPPQRMEHRVAGHRLVAREHVAHRVVADVADVDAPRWIGKHLEHIGFRARIARRRCDERAALVPDLLPVRIGL